ncbi:DNA polymerase III subunit epsilon [Agromyces intestinalis]|uniref:DNA polymerase III subunit epsilon n=1 Tax=Agromyces intestinalis TaxID=2592652 RepID=A0A5C1YJQ1_9MICO|nr:exonuclease domain-containing protein [Agromyces intestinalis]QEO15490.1 DNA polymerase III subunit epsilon [Agromyces intestinalis]
MPVDFTAIDFETANGSSASACSIGLVKVRDGRVVDRAHWLLRPPFPHDEFNEWNVRIHGITPDMVAGAPGWDARAADFAAFAEADWLVAHNAGFDTRVLAAISEAWSLEVPSHRYLCSLSVARRTYRLDSYRLPIAAWAAGFDDFAHHNAVADAEACAAIVVHAAGRHGVDDLAALAQATGVRPGALGRAVVPATPAVAASAADPLVE